MEDCKGLTALSSDFGTLLKISYTRIRSNSARPGFDFIQFKILMTMGNVITSGLILCFIVDMYAQPTLVVRGSIVDLVTASEPGRPFVLEVQVLDLVTRRPVQGAEVFVYQTNHKGDYENDANGKARIHGTAFSNPHGKLTFNTIYPRGYNNSSTGEHMHFNIAATGYHPSVANLMFDDYYKKRYDLDNPVSAIVYLNTIDEHKGALCGTATIFLRKK
jgi:hypothetical protein